MEGLKRVVATAAVGIFTCLPLFAQPSPVPSKGAEKISPFLKQQLLSKNVKELSALVILKDQANIDSASSFKNRPERLKFVYKSLSQVALDSQKDLVSYLQANKADYKQFYIVNMVALYNASPALIAEVAGRSDVEKIISNPLVKALPEVLKTPMTNKSRPKGPESSLVSVGAVQVWEEFKVTGENIVVAGQDTGVQWDHPSLLNAYRGNNGKTVEHNYSWHDAIRSNLGSGSNPCGLDTEAPCDDNDHGTHTVGTMVGDDRQGNQIGVAPGAQWVACRNMERGDGRPSTYIECFEWFLAPYAKGQDALTDGQPEYAPHIINNSWGCPPEEGCHEAEILPVLQVLKSAGIMVVASAGNEGPGCSTIANPPAMHSDWSFSVGAHNHVTGNIANFSSRGPSAHDGQVGPDITAPGENIRSAIRGSRYSGFMWSGTSMAGPHVAGAVALLWSARPELIGDIDTTSELLRATATPTQSSQTCGGIPGSEIPNNTFGYGKLNVYEAVKAAVGSEKK